MTISLPLLLVAGVFAAPVGLLLLAAQLVWPHRSSLVAGGAGALGSLLLLGSILWVTEVNFIGLYKPLAWVVALLAGYATLASAPYLWHLGALFQERYRSSWPLLSALAFVACCVGGALYAL